MLLSHALFVNSKQPEALGSEALHISHHAEVNLSWHVHSQARQAVRHHGEAGMQATLPEACQISNM